MNLTLATSKYHEKKKWESYFIRLTRLRWLKQIQCIDLFRFRFKQTNYLKKVFETVGQIDYGLRIRGHQGIIVDFVRVIIMALILPSIT